MPARTSSAPGPGPRAALAGFSEPTASWFLAAFAEPTQAQAQAWKAIGNGQHALVVAPTGSGKTLAAFLWAIDKLVTEPAPPDPKLRCRVLYISPLKALAVDIERNLRSPLAGVGQAMRRLGLPEPDVRVGVRTGDTAADERRQLASKPPDILITTPESLFLLLTSRARDGLRGVETVIIDEVHALAGGKRGAHLALSLERLDALRGAGAADAASPAEAAVSTDTAGQVGDRRPAGRSQVPEEDVAQRSATSADGGGLVRPAQRIGLSATVRPPEEVAAFLGGALPVTIVQPPSEKRLDLKIVVPVEDMSDLESAGGGLAWDPASLAGSADLAAGHSGAPIDASGGSPARPARIVGPAEFAAQAGVGNPGAAMLGSAAGPGHAASPGGAAAGFQTAGGADGALADPRLAPGGQARSNSIWPHVEAQVLDAIESHRSTIVFANSRRLAERLCARLNELAAERAAERADLASQDGAGPYGGTSQDDQAPGTVPPVVARAHHGSVSRTERSQIEEALKAGRLPAVVATSSLELGIDMGAVDLVIQVESPPSVASGLQRTGRAGHNVGDISRGVIFPKYQGDLVQATVVADRMRAGQIEELRMPRNPLDVLAQQIVAMTSMDDWTVDEVARVVRRAAPFAGLTRPVLEAVLDMLAGRYPSEEFAGLRPRLVWDRATGTLRGRPGGQRIAVTSGGTIPDRGLFGVFLAGPRDKTGRHSRRVGELDEEMVYESRVGDVFVLGASSWRIEDITADQVLVSPAPGQPGKLPFWHGDTPGRPAELGRAIGAYCRELGAASPEDATSRLRDGGLDQLAASNLLAYLTSQREATGYLPDDRTLVLERFRDELGDWRLILHSPYGAKVHAPWALAIAARLRERYGGMDVQAMYTDDGIVIRVPDSDDPPPAGFAVLDPDEVEQLVTAELGSSALFASRFRECAARALLLPRRQPGRRSPLWQQRQRAAQLLAVASGYGGFPIVLETMRECLQDVFDVPALSALMRELAGRRVRLVEVDTPTASPFGRSLLFRYIGAFMYEGDAPLAERRAQALALDSALLAELLGQADLRELLDPTIVHETEEDLQRLSPGRRCPSAEGLSDLIREIGPLSEAEIAARCADPAAAAAWLAQLAAQRRIIEVRVAGEHRWAAIEDAGRLRDALGVALPAGIPVAFTELLPDPLGDLVARYARTHGPFSAAVAAQRYGLGVAVITGMLHRLAADGRVAEGEFLPHLAGPQWCDSGVLRLLRRRCLARLRHEAEPVPPAVFAAFLPPWQNARHGGTARPDRAGGAGPGRRRRPTGPDAVYSVVEQLAGAAVPAGALESLILPARVDGYTPAMLDELTAAGEVVWAGAGALPGGDGWLVLAPAASAPLLFPAPGEITTTPVHDAVLAVLDGGGALFFRGLADRAGDRLTAVPPGRDGGAEPASPGRGSGSDELAPERPGSLADPHPADRARRPSDQAVAAAIWDLVWAGLLTNDTLAPLRTVLSAGRSWNPAPKPGGAGTDIGPLIGARTGRSLGARRPAFGRAVLPSNAGPPTVSGRWSMLPPNEPDQTRRLHARALSLLDRHGILIRGAAATERVPGGFGALYPVLRAMEDTGQCRRGYFVEGLGAAQFALPGAVDRMRAMADSVTGTLTGPAPPWPGAAQEPGQEPPGPAWPATGTSAWPGQASPEPAVVVLAAADPANAYGAALTWPPRPDETSGGHRPGRKAGALVVLASGQLVLYVERGGKTLLSWTSDPALLRPAAAALGDAVRAGALGRLTVERADGGGVYDSPLAQALEKAGFRPTPRGLRLRG
ncbi:MAG TPA: DEAD/DEAH box helicase [Streptosporangiaceae bacterium]|nr:DEAD/DEAH box helicase [Streptosporangiaceae bacterium]